MVFFKKSRVMCVLFIVLGVIIVLFLLYLIQVKKVNKGRQRAEEVYRNTVIPKFNDKGSLKKLSILPLIDSKSLNDDFRTENGVSYFASADDKNILLDLGFNRKKEHPSPLLWNMEKLGKSFKNIDFLVFSHAHLDHLGGMKEHKTKTFSISQGVTETGDIKVYAPVPLKASAFNPQLSNITVSKEPTVIMPGVYTIGCIPRHLFLMGNTEEQSLAFRIEGKGIVLLIGCGHQTIQRIIERTKMLFDEKIYAIFGGLHLPILNKGNVSLLSLVQYAVGSDYAPHQGLSRKDVYDAIESIKAENPKYVGISPHDSSDFSINAFKKAFGDKYVDINVGQVINL